MSAPLGLPPRQAACFSAIVDLLERELQPTARLVAFDMCLQSAGSVTQHLVRLERRGLIKRAGSPCGVIRLTKKGRSLAWGDGS
jgi:Mn-dependent DtxR family transcriptional regulator